MKRHVPDVIALTAAFVLGITLIGWQAVPLVAAFGGFFLGRDNRPGIVASIAALVATGGILLSYLVLNYPIGALTHRLAGAMNMPAPALIALSLVFPALLAAAGGALGGVVRGGQVTPPDAPTA